ncbi:MAG: hypothetical protein DWQ44_01985 [Bacteroidetes bacterium]|nr:MAG: hypothetical protein DWQ33_05715 [Bacteroidota bacterium]REK04747.1 MAG: hypothetical protein DWQ39_05880 [Bacteroidota bacterium]REK36221.1 MAG: hypothetical protein DWQ44_01985 [Bacteroidota bacterium]REK51117.1 MAG: hypothetical protein DWQ48_03240 [Bacteroidota bacterium]
MNPAFRKYLLLGLRYSALFLAASVFLVFLIGLFYGSEIKRIAVAELNKHLATEIQVRDLDFSMLRFFPYASFEMNDVLVMDAVETDRKDTLLYAKKLSLLLNMKSVLSREVIVKKIIAQDGSLNIRIYKDGSSNYVFWKNNSSENESAIDLRQISLQNISLQYEDHYSDQHYIMEGNDINLSGKFSESKFILNADADLLVKKFESLGVDYIINKKVRLESGIGVDLGRGLYRLQDSKVLISDFRFDVSGEIMQDSGAHFINLKVNSHEADISSFISMLPPSFVSYLSAYKSKGKFEALATIIGKTGNGNLPDVKLDFKIRNGHFTPSGSPVSLSSMELDGNYISKNLNGKSELNVNSLTALLDNHKISANFTIENLSSPFLTLNAKATLDLAKARHFIQIDTIENLSGSMLLNIAFAGKIADLPAYNKGGSYKIKSSGDIQLINAGFTLKKNPLAFRNIQGKLKLMDNDVYVENLKGNISESDLEINGNLKNFVNFLFIPGQPGMIKASLKSKNVNLDELLADKSDATSEDTSYIMKFNPRLAADLEINVANLHFRNFKASRMNGNVMLNNQVIRGKSLAFSSMDGMIFMDATINASRKDSVIMSCDAKITRIDINKLFYQLENFGQSTMTDRNVKGSVTAEVHMVSSWSEKLVMNPAKVNATCDIMIENGELIAFAPVKALARYVKVPDLDHIRFSTMKNNISISGRKIYIPAMEINSTALNLTASGVHDFDNIVDYRLVLLLSEVLGRKVRQNNSEFGEIEDDGLGKTRLMLTMKGPVDNPKFAYDRKGAGEKIKTDIAREKQNIKGILNEEFGWFKKEPVKQESRKKKEEIQIDWGEDN